MPCYPIKIGESRGFLCTRGRRKTKCHYCSRSGDYLCDYPVEKKPDGTWKTCDKNLCSIHAKKGISGETDFCREHFHLAKAAYERKKEKILKQQLPFEEKV